MPKINAYGLPRNIPHGVKLAIRQRCGFGCVICGSSIVEYEHVDPEFARARIHDPSRIALLCPMCHSRVTRNYLSKRRVKEAMASPKCRELGFSFSPVDIGDSHPYIKFAGITLKRCNIPIQVRDLPLFQIEPPEDRRAPFRLSAYFFDDANRPSLFIERNEWRAFSSQWDVETTGGSITVRSKPRRICLRLIFDPSDGIIVDRVDMRVLGYRFQGDADDLLVQMPDGGTTSFRRCLADGGHIGLMFR